MQGDSPHFDCNDELLISRVALRSYSSPLNRPVVLELDTSAGLLGSLAPSFPISHSSVRALTGPLPAVAGFIKSRLMTGKRIRVVINDKCSHPWGFHGDRRTTLTCLIGNCLSETAKHNCVEHWPNEIFGLSALHTISL